MLSENVDSKVTEYVNNKEMVITLVNLDMNQLIKLFCKEYFLFAAQSQIWRVCQVLKGPWAGGFKWTPKVFPT